METRVTTKYFRGIVSLDLSVHFTTSYGGQYTTKEQQIDTRLFRWLSICGFSYILVPICAPNFFFQMWEELMKATYEYTRDELSTIKPLLYNNPQLRSFQSMVQLAEKKAY